MVGRAETWIKSLIHARTRTNSHTHTINAKVHRVGWNVTQERGVQSLVHAAHSVVAPHLLGAVEEPVVLLVVDLWRVCVREINSERTREE